MNTRAVALAGMLAALNFIVMLVLGRLASLSAYAVAMLVMCAAVVECGTAAAAGAYAVSAALMLLLLPDKTAAVWYTVYFGLYPVIKSIADKKKSAVQWTIKIIYGAAALGALTLLLKLLAPAAVIPWWAYIAAVPVFIAADFVLTRAIHIYNTQIRKYLHK